MPHTVNAAGYEIEIPRDVEAEGRKAVVDYCHAYLCEPREQEEGPDRPPRIGLDPRALTVEELQDELESVDNLELLGALRMIETRKTGVEAIEARARAVQGQEPAEAEEA